MWCISIDASIARTWLENQAEIAKHSHKAIKKNLRNATLCVLCVLVNLFGKSHSLVPKFKKKRREKRIIIIKSGDHGTEWDKRRKRWEERGRERERKCIANNLHNTVYKWVFYVYAMYKCCCFFCCLNVSFFPYRSFSCRHIQNTGINIASTIANASMYTLLIFHLNCKKLTRSHAFSLALGVPYLPCYVHTNHLYIIYRHASQI